MYCTGTPFFAIISYYYVIYNWTIYDVRLDLPTYHIVSIPIYTLPNACLFKTAINRKS